jgi:hypothetical protein
MNNDDAPVPIKKRQNIPFEVGDLIEMGAGNWIGIPIQVDHQKREMIVKLFHYTEDYHLFFRPKNDMEPM